MIICACGDGASMRDAEILSHTVPLRRYARRGGSRSAMRATLWDTDRDTTAWLQAAFAEIPVPLKIVGTQGTLEYECRHADLDAFLIVECVRDRPEDIERCRQVLAFTDVEAYIVYASEGARRVIASSARGPLKWLLWTTDWYSLLALLRALREQVTANRVSQASPEITEHQHRVWALVAGGLSHSKIAAELHVSVGTVKKDIERVKSKLRVTTREELIFAFHRRPAR